MFMIYIFLVQWENEGQFYLWIYAKIPTDIGGSSA